MDTDDVEDGDVPKVSDIDLQLNKTPSTSTTGTM